MTFRAGFLRGLIIALACVCLSGCTAAGDGALDEQKEPHFLAGKNRISTLDFKGAISCFEKALQVNPQSASAHFELGWIYDEKEVDPAAAIYHYEHFLQLQPHAPNSDLARQRISACKQALAESVSLGPVTEKLQHQFEQLTEDKKQLTEENKRLKDDIEQWRSYAARLQTLTNPPPTPAIERPASVSRPNTQSTVTALAQASTPSTGSTGNRTHTVKAGETPSLIARKYGLKLDTLMAANPSVDPRRLRIGQVLRIPGS